MLDRTAAEDDALALRQAMLAVAKGDQAALRMVYQLTRAKLFGICLRILNDRAEAEDALQDVYVSLWQRAGSFDPQRASPISWLATFARNRAIDRLRAGRRLRDAGPIEEASDRPDEGPSAFALVAAAEERDRLHRCMEGLNPQQRGAIRDAFLRGFTYLQLAERTGTPLGTMKSWIRRGLQQLKACLEQ
ncbi:sigma-70 family RNA polymerase sigma factor [Sphingomonas sp. GCM10030256]|uniref:sigma-70 family RNA polymerase sigma factor n=1 Tax=Sphingomonas sp. GCM10030256 TaxID=3273427 RepID=UPI003605E53D